MKPKNLVLALGAFLLITVLLPLEQAAAANEQRTADLLIRLLKTGRSVISDNQALINDATRGDKGFTPAYMATQTIERFKAQTGVDLTQTPKTSQAKLLMQLLESEKDVVEVFQPIINKKGISFKGVLPARFARMTGERFFRRTGIRLKLTSLEYRYPANAPDQFEAEVLKLFMSPRYPRGKDYTKLMTMSGQRVLRVMSPEYAGASCLKCHGTPKGSRDITGGRKEGWNEGDLGGAISVVMPVNK